MSSTKKNMKSMARRIFMRVVRDKPIVEVLMYVQEEGKDEKEREKRAGKWREI